MLIGRMMYNFIHINFPYSPYSQSNFSEANLDHSRHQKLNAGGSKGTPSCDENLLTWTVQPLSQLQPRNARGALSTRAGHTGNSSLIIS